MPEYSVGIDMGGTNIKLVAVTRAGQLLQSDTDTTQDEGPATRDVWIAKFKKLLEAITEQQSTPPRWIGVSTPGLPARDGRSIAWMQGRMEAVQGLDWTAQFQSQSVIPVLNDAQAALLGEAWQGAAKGERDVVLLTLGTGVGGGILADGRLLRGHLGRAGHLGHITINFQGAPDIVGTPGSLEEAIGDCSVAQRSAGRFDSTKQLVQAHLGGDKDATEIWLRSIRALAAGIVSITNAIDPAVVIIGGGVAKAGATLFAPLDEYLNEWEWRPTGTKVNIVAAQLGEFAGAWGAAYHALNVNNEAQI